MTRKDLISQADEAQIKGNFKLALLRLKQSIEPGITQNGAVTRPMIEERIKELNNRL